MRLINSELLRYLLQGSQKNNFFNGAVAKNCSSHNAEIPFDVNHSLNFHLGGYNIIRHNEIRDVLADLRKTVCSDVKVESLKN